MPRRRTFATGILPFAHSMLTALARSPPLRHPAYACQQRRSRFDEAGTWFALLSSARPGGPGTHQPTEVGQAAVGRMPSRRVYTATQALRAWAAPHGLMKQVRGLRCYPAPGPEGRVSTSRRRSAKKKSQDAMFFVNAAGRVRTSRRRSAKQRSAGCRAVACIQQRRLSGHGQPLTV